MKMLLVVGLLPFIFAGCNVGPKYKKPEFHPPATFYTQEQASSNSAADLHGGYCSRIQCSRV